MNGADLKERLPAAGLKSCQTCYGIIPINALWGIQVGEPVSSISSHGRETCSKCKDFQFLTLRIPNLSQDFPVNTSLQSPPWLV